ncbi:LysE family transporter [Cellulosimicrobium arenosum]|uniref:LysE family transporter n=1 Tax=Cellulosimicrobium arenosum TaxID=2708133 RepID=A0A927J1E0_9MICO|nr:LysE family transporter [Cellulosimicrobium arenosum]MBD8080124.1 LysE family transporter [Cellulosimicrobium arenosum]
MAWSVWTTLAAAGVLVSLTPGAGAVNTMSNSIGVGWARSIWGILGQQLALVVHVLVVAAGVGVLVAGSPVLFAVVRYAGAGYLVYLGIRQWRARPRDDGGADVARRTESRLSMVRRGLLVNLTNPKAVVFFLAFIPQFVRPDRPLLPQYVVLGVTVVVIDVLVMWFFFATAATGLRRLTREPRGQRAVDRLFGSLFVGVGVLLAAVH